MKNRASSADEEVRFNHISQCSFVDSNGTRSYPVVS